MAFLSMGVARHFLPDLTTWLVSFDGFYPWINLDGSVTCSRTLGSYTRSLLSSLQKKKRMVRGVTEISMSI